MNYRLIVGVIVALSATAGVGRALYQLGYKAAVAEVSEEALRLRAKADDLAAELSKRDAERERAKHQELVQLEASFNTTRVQIRAHDKPNRYPAECRVDAVDLRLLNAALRGGERVGARPREFHAPAEESADPG